MKHFILAGVLSIAACQSVTTTSPAPLVPARAAPLDTQRPSVELGSRIGSGIVAVHVGRSLIAYVADEDDAMLRVIDVDNDRELTSFPLDGKPAQVITLSKGRLAVTLTDVSKVEILEGAGTRAWPLEKVASIDAPSEPIGLARMADGASFAVTSGWGHALTVFDVSTFAQRFSVDLGREPRGLSVSEDGKRAFVSHAAGDGLSIVDLAHPMSKPRVWRLEAESWTPGSAKVTAKSFGRKANNGHAIAMSEDPAGRVFVPHALSHTTVDDSFEGASGYGSSDSGPNDVFDVAVIDAAKATPIDFESRPSPDGEDQLVRLASDDGRCLVPRAAVATGAKLFVACLDTNKVLELDAGWFHPAEMVTRTFDVPAGPVALAVDKEGERLLVWSQFARKLTLLPMASGATFTLASFGVPAAHQLDAHIAHGRELFFHQDLRVSDDGRVCASCHPDGRDDGLVWTTPEGPRQTPMLAGRLDGVAPYGWRGTSADIPTHLKTTFSRLRGKGLDGKDRDDLVTFIQSMQAPKNTKVDATLAKRGEAIFASKRANCASCHGAGGDLPDGELHNVRSWAQGDVLGLFDTPSLRAVGGTAPYFHDGRYKDLHTLLASVDGTMGHTKYLSPDEMNALETYLRSL